MINFILSPLQKGLAFLGVVAFGVLAVFGYGARKKVQGKEEVLVDQIKKDLVKKENARDAAFKEKRDVDGVSDSDLVDRLRGRSSDWGKL